MNNPNIQQSPTLRMEAVSINCILRDASVSTANRNLLTVADSLTAEQRYALLYFRLILLILYACRNAQLNKYDEQNRLKQAIGKYGTEVYEYGDNGNLTQRGQYTLIYGDPTCLGLPDLILFIKINP